MPQTTPSVTNKNSGYTAQFPDVTTSSSHSSLYVQERECCIFVLPNYEFACPGCGFITFNISTLDCHIKGKGDRPCCVDYACKFGAYAGLELSKESTKKNNNVERRFPNITWKKKMRGITVTDEDLATANTANKKWLVDKNFATTNRKEFQVDKISDELLAKFLKMKQDNPTEFEDQFQMWHPINRHQFDTYEAAHKATHLKNEFANIPIVAAKPPHAKAMDKSKTSNDNEDSEKVDDDDGKQQESATVVSTVNYAAKVTHNTNNSAATPKPAKTMDKRQTSNDNEVIEKVDDDNGIPQELATVGSQDYAAKVTQDRNTSAKRKRDRMTSAKPAPKGTKTDAIVIDDERTASSAVPPAPKRAKIEEIIVIDDY